MAEVISSPVATEAPAKSSKKAPAKKPAKVAPAKKDKKPIKKASDGTLRGVAKPKNWKPAKQMGAYDKDDILTLRKPQVRLLRSLSKAKGPLNRGKLSEASGVEYAWLCNWIGQPDADARANREKRWGFTSLLTIGLVKCKLLKVMDKDEWVYEITPAGRSALTKYDAAISAKEKAEKDAEKEKQAKAKERAKKAAAKAKE